MIPGATRSVGSVGTIVNHAVGDTNANTLGAAAMGNSLKPGHPSDGTNVSTAAHAYAQGNSIHLGPSGGGQQMVGHEAAHVVQQVGAAAKPVGAS